MVVAVAIASWEAFDQAMENAVELLPRYIGLACGAKPAKPSTPNFLTEHYEYMTIYPLPATVKTASVHKPKI